MLKVHAKVYDLKNSRKGEKDGKSWSFHKQACQINTPDNIPDVPFDYQVESEADFLPAGIYTFDLVPASGKFNSIDWRMTNPKLVKPV